MSAEKPATHICVVPCPRDLRDAFLALCERRAIEPSTLTRAALALLAERPDLAVTDPGPGRAERESVVSTSGRRRTRTVLPRLRLRVVGVVAPVTIRIALATCLSLTAPAARGTAEAEIARLREENERLRAALDRVAPRPGGRAPVTPAQSAWVMGFPNEWGLDAATVTARFRQLAMIYHPDTGIAADADRMAQISAARGILLRRIKA
jgi:hypothetical protein